MVLEEAEANIKNKERRRAMSFNNGVPITVVSNIRNVSILTESASRRRAEEDARIVEIEASAAAKH